MDIPLFATSAKPLQLYHSPWVKILAFINHLLHVDYFTGPVTTIWKYNLIMANS